MIFRNVYLISTMLSSTEAWYGVTKEDVKKLEKVDIYYHQSVLSQVPHEMVYLELGVLPIIYISMLRKVLYLQQILKQENEKSLLFRFFKAQMNNSRSGDWAIQIMKYFEEIEIKIYLEEI